MRNLKHRLQRIEELVSEEESLTIEDLELFLSVLPQEYADAVRRKIIEMAKENRAAGKYDRPVKKRTKTQKPLAC